MRKDVEKTDCRSRKLSIAVDIRSERCESRVGTVDVWGLYQVGFRWMKRKEEEEEEEKKEEEKIWGGGGISDIPGCLREDSSNGCMQTLKNVPSSKWSGGFLHHAERNNYECLLFAVNFH